MRWTKLERRHSGRWRRTLRLLALFGMAPPMALAFYSLTEPWARARLVFLWGISRSPGAALLVVLGLVTALVGGMAVASGRRPRLAAGVHLGSGVLLCTVSLLAFRMIEDAGVRALGLVPLASVRPGRGLQYFFLASILVMGLGMVEWVLVLHERRRRVRSASGSEPKPRLGPPAPPEP